MHTSVLHENRFFAFLSSKSKFMYKKTFSNFFTWKKCKKYGEYKLHFHVWVHTSQDNFFTCLPVKNNVWLYSHEELHSNALQKWHVIYKAHREKVSNLLSLCPLFPLLSVFQTIFSCMTCVCMRYEYENNVSLCDEHAYHVTQKSGSSFVADPSSKATTGTLLSHSHLNIVTSGGRRPWETSHLT